MEEEFPFPGKQSGREEKREMVGLTR